MRLCRFSFDPRDPIVVDGRADPFRASCTSRGHVSAALRDLAHRAHRVDGVARRPRSPPRA